MSYIKFRFLVLSFPSHIRYTPPWFQRPVDVLQDRFAGSELSPPQRLLQWGNGEKTGKREITGKLKHRGRAGDGGKGEDPSGPRALSFPFSPAPAHFNSPLPIPPYRRKRSLRRKRGFRSKRDGPLDARVRNFIFM